MKNETFIQNNIELFCSQDQIDYEDNNYVIDSGNDWYGTSNEEETISKLF